MSHNDLLRIQNLKVCAGEKEILHGIDLDIHENEVHVLMGPNGTGKSTLGAALMGNPAYTVTGGDIIYKGQNINEMPDNERAKHGIFLSFQNPIEIPGITVSAFIRSALEAKTGKRVRLFSFKKELEEKMALAGTVNMGAYLRKMAIDGYLLRLDLPELREMISLLRRCSGNLNQIAKRVNESGRIYETDLKEIQEQLNGLWNKAREILLALSEKE